MNYLERLAIRLFIRIVSNHTSFGDLLNRIYILENLFCHCCNLEFIKSIDDVYFLYFDTQRIQHTQTLVTKGFNRPHTICDILVLSPNADCYKSNLYKYVDAYVFLTYKHHPARDLQQYILLLGNTKIL